MTHQLVWLRSDLRVRDNPALSTAMTAGPTIACFVISEKQWHRHGTGDRRIAFLLRSLAAVAQAHRSRARTHRRCRRPRARGHVAGWRRCSPRMPRRVMQRTRCGLRSAARCTCRARYECAFALSFRRCPFAGGWQWSASTGTDAAPYFRIFNPVAQARRFDTDGRFVKRYVPELEGRSGRDLSEPWRVSPAGYPAPIVEHGFARKRALARFGK